MPKVAFMAVIASGTFFANPTWGAEGLPRNAAGDVITNRWIQTGESFWINPSAWVQTYQHYCHSIESAPKIEVDLPDQAAPEVPSTEEQKPEPVEPAPAPAPKKKPAPKPKAVEPAPAPEPTPDPAPAPDQADQADPEE